MNVTFYSEKEGKELILNDIQNESKAGNNHSSPATATVPMNAICRTNNRNTRSNNFSNINSTTAINDNVEYMANTAPLSNHVNECPYGHFDSVNSTGDAFPHQNFQNLSSPYGYFYCNTDSNALRSYSSNSNSSSSDSSSQIQANSAFISSYNEYPIENTNAFSDY